MRSSITTRLYGGAVLGVAVLILAQSVLFFFIDRNSLTATLLKDAAITRDRVSKSLSDPLWKLDSAQIRVILGLELLDEDLSYIVVWDEYGDAAAGMARSAGGAIEPYGGEPVKKPETTWTYFSEIEQEGLTIGVLEMGVSRAAIDGKLWTELFSVLARSMVVTVLGLVFLIQSLRSSVVKPIGDLRTAVARFAAKDFAARAPIARDDEVGELAAAFNAMADEISGYSAKLEGQVKERTDQLIEAEKMAFIGSLVSGVAHEINTPVGVAVTAASHLSERVEAIGAAFSGNSLKKSDLESFLGDAAESAEILLANLKRASDFVRSFKQVAVDQSSEEARVFDAKAYLEEIVFSLRPKLKKTKHRVVVEGPEGLKVRAYPGLVSQIVTNFIMNSLQHGLSEDRAGTIRISAGLRDGSFVIIYEDDGRGIPKEALGRIFMPFFTTMRDSGGTGLGLYIVYSGVKKIGGVVQCESETGMGVRFTVTLPLLGKPEGP